MLSSVGPGDRDGGGRPPGALDRHFGWWLALLGAVSAAYLFHGLDRGRLIGDELIYERVVGRMVATGDWVYLEDGPSRPYLNKPPLYFWLTAATWDGLGGGNLACRFWSAACGVGCVLCTCLLGRRLFGPGVGLLAGVLLLTNRRFVDYHGARSCGFDAALTLLTVLSLLLWLRLRGRPDRWGWWLLVGACAGCANLLKPLAGLPLLGVVGAHHFSFDRGVGWRWRVVGPVLALVVGGLVAAPWYAAQWLHYGDWFVRAVWWENYVTRATVGLDDWHLRGPWYYPVSVTRSSPAFALAVPALLAAAWGSFSGPGRHACRLVVAPTLLYVGVFSLSRSKLEWYVYPVFPLVALAVARLLAVAAERLAARAARPVPEVATPPAGEARRAA